MSADLVSGHAIAPCVCTDPEADLLRDLIALGMDQIEASRLLWGPEPDSRQAVTS